MNLQSEITPRGAARSCRAIPAWLAPILFFAPLLALAAPSISSFSPSSALAGTTVTINGSGFSATPASNTVSFGDVPATVLTATSSRITASVPQAAVTGRIRVTVSGSTATSASNFSVIPAIAGFLPDRGAAGASVTIDGSGFATSPAGNVVKFNGTTATVTSATANQIVATVPTTATTGPVRVTVGSRTATSATNFIVTPLVATLTPASGTVGISLRIDGRGFSSTPANNEVRIGGVAAPVLSATTTRLTVTVPAGARTGPVTVTVAGNIGTSATEFSVIPVLEAWSAEFSAGGSSGSEFTVTGSGFDPDPGASRVSIAGIAAEVVSATATAIVARVPEASVTGTLRLEVGGRSVDADQRFVVYRRLPLDGDTVHASADAGDPIGLVAAVPEGGRVGLGITGLSPVGHLVQIQTEGTPVVGCGGTPDCFAGPFGPRPSAGDTSFLLTHFNADAFTLDATATTPWDVALDPSGTALTHDYSRPGQFGSYTFEGLAGDRFSLDLGDVASRRGLPMVAKLQKHGDTFPAATLNVDPGPDRSVDLPPLPSGGNWRVDLLTQDGLLAPLTISMRAQTVALSILSTYPRVTRRGDAFIVTVSTAALDASRPPPTGEVVVEDLVGGSCRFTLPANSCSLTSNSPWQTSLRALYLGDANHASASSPLYPDHRFSNTGVEVVITSINPQPARANAGATVKVVVISSNWMPPYGGQVRVTDGAASCSPTNLSNGLEGNTASGTCTLRSAAGVHRVTASYSGDSYNGGHAGGYSIPTTHVVSGDGPGAPLPAGSQICGFNPDVVQSTTTPLLPMTHLPGALPSLGIAASIGRGEPISAAITWPEPGAELQGTSVDVAGVFTGPANTGVTVNGVVGHTADGRFLVPNVPITSGTNRLELVATTLTGVTHASDITVIGVAGTPELSIEVLDGLDEVSIGPTTRYFAVHPDAVPANETVLSSTLDLEGDGDVDIHNPTDGTYGISARPGLYQAVFQVTTDAGRTYTARRHYLVEDLVVQRGLVCDVYGYLRERVSQGDAPGAALAFDLEVRDRYDALFSALGGDLASASSEFGEIVAGVIGTRTAYMTVARDQDAQRRSGFPLQIARGLDGVWRIVSL